MVTKVLFRAVVICAFLALMMSPAFAQPAQPTNDPAVPKREPKQREGLLDFALKHVNSSDRDYGRCIDEGRKILLEDSIENGYFWSNLISLGLLGCSLIIIIHQHKARRRRELIVAESLAQYQHALARSDVQIQEATKRNMALMEALSSTIERGSHNDPVEQQPKNAVTVGKKDSARETRTPSDSAASPVSGVRASASRESAPSRPSAVAPSPAKGSPDVDLIARINVVQQQLTGSQEREKQLRRQLNDAELRLQKEQQKNRSLKGE